MYGVATKWEQHRTLRSAVKILYCIVVSEGAHDDGELPDAVSQMQPQEERKVIERRDFCTSMQ